MRSKWYNMDVVDIGDRSFNAFGEVSFRNIYLKCRSANVISIPQNFEKYNEKAWAAFSFKGFRSYDTGQKHIVSDWIVDCGSIANPLMSTYQYRKAQIWSFPHGVNINQFQLVMRNISYVDSPDPAKIMSYDVGSKDTFSPFFMVFVDADGSMSRHRDNKNTTCVPSICGSSGMVRSVSSGGDKNNVQHLPANLWFKLTGLDSHTARGTNTSDERCNLRKNSEYPFWVCDQGKVGLASFEIIPNGRDMTTSRSKKEYGRITHWGDTMNQGIPMSGDPQVVGPFEHSTQGGWFLTFYQHGDDKTSQSCPKNVKIDNVQMNSGQVLIIALRYPANTTFKITRRFGVRNDMIYTYTSATNVSQIRRDSTGTKFYFDNTYLYLRLFPSALMEDAYCDAGVYIPARVGGREIQIKATWDSESGCGVDNWCTVSNYPGAPPKMTGSVANPESVPKPTVCPTVGTFWPLKYNPISIPRLSPSPSTVKIDFSGSPSPTSGAPSPSSKEESGDVDSDSKTPSPSSVSHCVNLNTAACEADPLCEKIPGLCQDIPQHGPRTDLEFYNSTQTIHIGVNGSNVRQCGSIISPCKTLEYVARMLVPGDIVAFHRGVYVQNTQKITISGTPRRPIKITRYQNDHVKFEPGAIFNEGLGWAANTCLVFENCNHLIIEGLHINGNSSSVHFELVLKTWFWSEEKVPVGFSGVQLIGGSNITLHRNVLHDLLCSGIYIKGTRYVTIRHNIVYRIGHHCLVGGGGIMYGGIGQVPGNYGNDDPDDLNFYRMDYYGNLVFDIEQRIYSWPKASNDVHYVLDEGKMLDTQGATNDIHARFRIAENILLWPGIAGIRMKRLPGGEVHNNLIYLAENRPDAKGVRCTDNLNNPTLRFFNNTIYSAPFTYALDLRGCQPYEGDPERFFGNYLAGGGVLASGHIRPETMQSVVDLGHEGNMFKDPSNGDFNYTNKIPDGVGVSSETYSMMMEMAREYNIVVENSKFVQDHEKETQLIISNHNQHFSNPTFTRIDLTSTEISWVVDAYWKIQYKKTKNGYTTHLNPLYSALLSAYDQNPIDGSINYTKKSPLCTRLSGSNYCHRVPKCNCVKLAPGQLGTCSNCMSSVNSSESRKSTSETQSPSPTPSSVVDTGDWSPSPTPSSVVDTDNTSPTPSSVVDAGNASPSPSSLVKSESSETGDDSKKNDSSNYEAVVGGSQSSACPPFALLWLMHIAAVLWTI